MAQHEFISHPLTLRRVQVRRTTLVTPRMRRITLGGEQLGTFTVDGMVRPAFTSPGFDDHVKLVFAADGDLASALPEQVPGGIEWGPSETRLGRDYTPRRVDPRRGEIDLDFVLHGDGPAASWARGAAPGDELCFVGPKSSTVLPGDLDWIVLAGDETALPAIGRFLDERPVQAPAHLVLAVTDDEARQDLALGPGDRVEWIRADDAAEAAGLITPAVRSLGLPAGADAGRGYVWAAAESRALIPLRRYLQRELSMPKSHLNITGYWHAEAPSALTTGAGDAGGAVLGQRSAPGTAGGTTPAPTGSGAAQEALEPPVGWFAARTALRLGLLDAVADHPGATRTGIARHLGLPAGPLGPLTAVLVDHGILTGDDDGLDLGPLGEELLVDEHLQGELTGLEADLALSLDQLAPFLQDPDAGTTAWSRRHGKSLWNSARTSRERYAELVEEGGVLDYLLDVFMDDPLWAAAETVAASGPGSAAVVRALLRRRRASGLTVWEDGAGLQVLQAELPGNQGLRFCALSSPDGVLVERADVLVAGLALAYRTDAESADFLGRARDLGHRLVLLEHSRPDGLDPHAREHALLSLAGTGTAHRGPDALGSLAAGAGWGVDRSLSLGWGIEALYLTAR